MNNAKSRASVPEIVAITLLSVLMLIAGVLIAAQFGNFSMRGQPGTGKMLSSEPMPAGMIMGAEQNTQQMKEMAAVDPAQVGNTAPEDARGDQLLQPHVLIWRQSIPPDDFSDQLAYTTEPDGSGLRV